MSLTEAVVEKAALSGMALKLKIADLMAPSPAIAFAF